MKRFLLLFWAIPLLCGAYPLTPDDAKTPGERCSESDPDFYEYRYEEEIPYCKRKVSEKLKNEIYREYGIKTNEHSQYTIDHLIPLALGGSNDRDNLWPEHKKVKALRPGLEMELYLDLRDGVIDQEEAIELILDAKFYPYKEKTSTVPQPQPQPQP